MFENFSPDSKVWIYQSERPFTENEINFINDSVHHFTKQWTAHNMELKATGCVVEDRFILMMVDETQAGASGCSIDKSVHFIQQLQQQLNTNLFNRLLLSYKTENGIETISLSKTKDLIYQGVLNPDSIIFNTTVQSKSAFETKWLIPLKKSWLAPKLSVKG